MSQIFRFLRVLEYVGTRERLDQARETRGVKGMQDCGSGLKIYEAILGVVDQPMTGQVTRWALQNIVDAADGKLLPDNEPMRKGYTQAMQDLLAFISPETTSAGKPQ